MKNRVFIIVFATVLVITCAVSLYIMRWHTPKSIVLVKSDNKIIRRIDLAAVTSPYEFSVKSDYGYNTVYVSHNSIKIIDADCPDKICIAHGELKSNYSPIVCLPHKLTVIYDDSNTDIDVIAN